MFKCMPFSWQLFIAKKKKGFFSKLSFKIFHDFLLKSFAVDCAVLNFLTYEQTNNRKGLL